MSKFAGLALRTEEASRMEIIHPSTRQPIRDGSGAVAYIDLFSADSSVARQHQSAVGNRRLAMRRGAKLTIQELQAEAVELLVALTKGWHLLDLEGSPIAVEFSHDNARELYGEPSLAWLREQVDEFVAERGNFSKASSTN
jgi:hypothetical protein